MNCFACRKPDPPDAAEAEAEKRAKDEYRLAVVLKEPGKVTGELYGHPEGTGPGGETTDTSGPRRMPDLKYGGKGYA